MAKITLGTLTSAFSSIAKLNVNFAAIAAALQDRVLYRDNPSGEPNQMENALDMNNNDIQNCGAAAVQSLTIAGVQVVPSTAIAVGLTYFGAGTVSAPGVYVVGDANTGLYQTASDHLAIACGGIKILEASTSGVDVTGTLAVSGATSVAGGLTISAGGLNVTGTVTLPAFAIHTNSTCATQAPGNNSTKLASTAYVDAAVTAVAGVTSFAAANAGSATTLTASTNVIVQFNTETLDVGSEYDHATGIFTATATGKYRVQAQVRTVEQAFGTADYFQIALYKNTSTRLFVGTRQYDAPTGNAALSSVLSTVVSLTAGDTLCIKGYSTKASTVEHTDIGSSLIIEKVG